MLYQIDKKDQMTIEISDTILEKAGLSKAELKLELAIYLFKENKVSIGQASVIAGLHKIMFQKELAKRKILIHYSIEDLENDLINIKKI